MIEQVQGWDQELQRLHTRIAPRFRRAEPRRRAHAYLQALLSPVDRKNGWQIAEQVGELTPDGIQRLLNAADWGADVVRDDLRAYVVEHLADPDAVLVIDKTGFLKKGTKSVGVKRQYSGTAGRIENCQIGVCLCYASQQGAAFLDRALYLSKEWARDQHRRQEADVPDAVSFATTPELATAMVLGTLDAGVACGWVTGDTIYGGDRTLRFLLAQRGQPFVLAVPSNEPLWRDGPSYIEARQIAADFPPDAWQRLSAGDGAKGPRWFDWAWQPLWRLQLIAEEQVQGHYLLVHRSIDDPKDLAYYVVMTRKSAA
jgi:SRSO17 transposase